MESERPDSRDSHAHGRQSHIVNKKAEERQRNAPEDPVTPSLDTKI